MGAEKSKQQRPAIISSKTPPDSVTKEKVDPAADRSSSKDVEPNQVDEPFSSPVVDAHHVPPALETVVAALAVDSMKEVENEEVGDVNQPEQFSTTIPVTDELQNEKDSTKEQLLDQRFVATEPPMVPRSIVLPRRAGDDGFPKRPERWIEEHPIFANSVNTSYENDEEYDMSDPNTFSTKGLPLSHFHELVVEWGGRSALQGLTTTEVNIKFLSPKTQQSGLSLCAQYYTLGGTLSSQVQHASFFVSHAWSYKFLDVLDALDAFFPDNKDVVLWFDLFSNSQHNTAAKHFEWWETTFMNAVKKIGNVVMVLQPWSNPTPLLRSWCIFEIYSASVTGSSFHVAMTPTQTEEFMTALNDISVFNDILSRVSCERSQAFKQTDRDSILTLVKQTIGFTKLDRLVFETLSKWVVKVLIRLITESPENSALEWKWRRVLGKFHLLQYRLEEAECIFVECYHADMGHAIYGVEEQMACTALMDLADVWTAQERFEEAEAAYKYCYYRCLKLFGDQNRITASCARRMVGCLRASDKTQIANQLLFKLLDFHYDLMKVDEVAAADYFFDVAAVFVVEGGYDKVEEMVSQALQERAERLGNSHPNTVVAAVLLGTLYRTLGKYEEATMIFEESLETNRRILGNFHPNTLESINGLGQLYGRQGRFEEAEALLKESVETHRLLFTSSHSKTLSAISELAALYKADHTIPGNLERAVSLFEEYKKTSEFLQIIVANSRALYPVGQELTNLRAVTGCSVYIDSSITIRPSSTLVNGESVIETRVPPSYISCLSNLGKLYVLQGKMQEAYDCFHPCFFLSLDLYGRTNAATLDAQLQLGKFYFQIGAFKHADNILANCWLLQSDVFGNEHKSTLETMLFWAQTKDQLQKTEEAKRMYVSCLDSLRNIVDDNDPLVILCLNRLATLCTLQKDFAGSIPLYSALYAALVREGLELNSETLRTANSLGCMYLMVQKYDEAEKYLKLSVEGRKTALGLHPDYLNSLKQLSTAYVQQKKWKEAFLVCTEGHDGSLKLLGESDPKTVFWKETLEYISGKIVD